MLIVGSTEFNFNPTAENNYQYQCSRMLRRKKVRTFIKKKNKVSHYIQTFLAFIHVLRVLKKALITVTYNGSSTGMT